jgi:hypothetical protein
MGRHKYKFRKSQGHLSLLPPLVHWCPTKYSEPFNNSVFNESRAPKSIIEDYVLLLGVALGEACTIVLRGATQQILDEAERSLHDALCVLQQTVKETRTVFGGGELKKYLCRVHGFDLFLSSVWVYLNRTSNSRQFLSSLSRVWNGTALQGMQLNPTDTNGGIYISWQHFWLTFALCDTNCLLQILITKLNLNSVYQYHVYGGQMQTKKTIICKVWLHSKKTFSQNLQNDEVFQDLVLWCGNLQCLTVHFLRVTNEVMLTFLMM